MSPKKWFLVASMAVLQFGDWATSMYASSHLKGIVEQNPVMRVSGGVAPDGFKLVLSKVFVVLIFGLMIRWKGNRLWLYSAICAVFALVVLANLIIIL